MPSSPTTTENFLRTIRHLRHYEEFLLFGEVASFNDPEDTQLTEWLFSEYQEEVIGYPGSPPAFDGKAALWAAKTVYIAGQLLISRKQGMEEMTTLFPYCDLVQSPEAVLSADLTLRFLPDIIANLEAIDKEDMLIDRLQRVLETWHYSGVGTALKIENPDLSVALANECLLRMYADRVIKHKNILLASQPVIRSEVAAALGIHAEQLWKEFHQNSMS